MSSKMFSDDEFEDQEEFDDYSDANEFVCFLFVLGFQESSGP